jgi:DNA invertase Pin-like site-specific DNA recombinase
VILPLMFEQTLLLATQKTDWRTSPAEGCCMTRGSRPLHIERNRDEKKFCVARPCHAVTQPSTKVEGCEMAKSTGKFVAYHRVSTAKQGRSGLGLEAQKAAVLAYLNGGNWKLLAEFTEVESGKDSDRPQLAAAMDHCKLTGATLVISKLDRLSRNVAFLSNLMETGVEFVACDNPHATKFTLHILSAVAQHEREAISTRTKEALMVAKARGQHLGGSRGAPAPSSRKGVEARQAKADAFAKRVYPTLAKLQQSGLGLNAMAAELTARGIKTSEGGTWRGTTVRRVLDRLK